MTSPNEPDDRLASALRTRAERGHPRGSAATLAGARALAADATLPTDTTRPAGRRWATAAAAVLVIGAVAGGIWVARVDEPGDGTLDSTAPELCELLAAPVIAPTEGEPDVVAYLYPGTSPERRAEIARSLRGTQVDHVQEVDEAASYEEYRRLFADEPAMLASVQPDDLPTSIQLWLTDPDDRTDAADSLRSSGIQDVYEVVARGDGPTVLDALVWPGHDPSAGVGARSIATAVYRPPWPEGADAIARVAQASSDDDLARAVGVVVAEVELRVGSRLAPGVGVPPAVVDAAALIEATARDRCDLEPHRAFTRSGRGETSDTIPASGSGD
ncbi:MAG: permease-like cell division protein FtsX [Actinobacteria bacterium]|nr:permease-like cell division protein FtsX [Actinomycetota bacterium]